LSNYNLSFIVFCFRFGSRCCLLQSNCSPGVATFQTVLKKVALVAETSTETIK